MGVIYITQHVLLSFFLFVCLLCFLVASSYTLLCYQGRTKDEKTTNTNKAKQQGNKEKQEKQRKERNKARQQRRQKRRESKERKREKERERERKKERKKEIKQRKRERERVNKGSETKRWKETTGDIQKEAKSPVSGGKLGLIFF